MRKRSVLVGRDAERAVIEAALERCRANEGGVLLVSGEAGVGKSRLVADALRGWQARRLRASAVGGGGSYGLLREMLLPVHEEIADADVRRSLGPLLPGNGMPDAECDSATLADSLRRAFRLVAGDGPAVVVLEDLHWTDAATLDILPALAVAIEREPLLVVATYRSDQLPRAHPLRRARTALRRGGGLTEVALRPLTREESGELLAGLLGWPVTARLLTEIHSRADGLPFVVEELVATLTEAGSLRERDGMLDVAADAGIPLPESVVDAVLARTADLRTVHLEAVELAAVLGVGVQLPVLAELVSPDDVDQLLDAGLLVEQARAGSEVAVFRHALVREALYGGISWARRRRHHVRAAMCLTDHAASPEIVAEHWISAHDYDRARPLLLAAAEQNCSLHAYRDAARLARRALEVWPERVDPDGRIIALERLAGCAELCDEHESAADVWATLARLRQEAGDVAGVGAANRRLATAREMLGDFSGAIAAREAAAAGFDAGGAHGEAAEERLALAGQLRSAAHKTSALAHAAAATESAKAANRPDLLARSLGLQGAIRAEIGDGDRGVALAREGLALAMALQVPESAGEALYELASALEFATDYAAAADTYESAFELCRTNDITELAHLCLACMSPAVRLMGDWDRSMSICTEVLGSDQSPLGVRMVAQEESGLISALRGDCKRARGPLRRAAAFGRAHELFPIEVGAVWGLALVADIGGEEHTASRAVSTLLERYAEKEEWHYALPALRWISTFLAQREDGGRAAHCHRLLATAATRNSSPKVLSTLAHAGGELSLAAGDATHAAGQFGRAVELLHGITAPYEKALSELRWGVALASDGHRQAAADVVTSAYRTARRLGAKPLAQGCAARLEEMGEQVDRRLGRLAARSLEPAGLTRREKQVLRLLNDGRTNRQIAGELFVSTRTVDMHVRNVLTKLDCPSRVSAARRGVELGIIERVPTR